MNKIKFVNQSDLYTAVLEIWAKACDRFMVKGYIRVQPTANSLTYTGVAQALCTAGIGSGTIVYSLDGSTYTTTIPSQTNAGTYTVYYKALSSFDSTESPVYTLSCGIDKATPTVVVPTAKVLTYNGSAQELLNAGSTDLGTLKYSLDNSTWSTSIPTATNGGSYTAYYKVEGDSNINDVASTSVQCSINEKQPTITIELSQDTYTYDGTAKTPTVTVKDGATTIDPSEYTVTYSNNINAGTATVTITDNTAGDYNVSGVTTFTISKALGSVTTAPTAITGLTPTGSAQALVNAGSSDTGTMMYNLNGGAWSSSIPTATNVGSYAVGYKAAESTNYTESATGSVTVKIDYPYVEIGGTKWATMNIGANSVTDTGLYFQWGDTQGYTASLVGSGTGKKEFYWTDYKYATNVQQWRADMTKYNSTDGKTVLEASDDAVQANWGGSWRMPTDAEYAALGNAVNTTWTDNYQGSGVAGLICTDKTDSSKTLFFPACGGCGSGSIDGVGSEGSYWSSSLVSYDVPSSYNLYFRDRRLHWQLDTIRFYGFSVRGVVG